MRKLILILFAAAAAAMAQGQANCSLSFGPWTTSNTTAYQSNQTPANQCAYWVLQYQVTGTPTISIAFQSSVGATAPAGWGNFSGAVTSGSNPSTSTSCATVSNCVAVFTGYVPFYRIAVTLSGTGTVSGTLQGYRTYVAAGGNTPAAGCSNPCPVIGPDSPGQIASNDPVQIAGWDYQGRVRSVFTDINGNLQAVGPVANGSNLDGTAPVLSAVSDGVSVRVPVYCSSRAAISLANSGVIVSGAMGKKTYVCEIMIANSAGVNVTIDSGTGSACGTGTTGLTGAFQSVSTAVLPFQSYAPLVTAANGDDLCLTLSAPATVGGVVLYAQF